MPDEGPLMDEVVAEAISEQVRVVPNFPRQPYSIIWVELAPELLEMAAEPGEVLLDTVQTARRRVAHSVEESALYEAIERSERIVVLVLQPLKPT